VVVAPRRPTGSSSRWLTCSCAAERRSGISGAASCGSQGLIRARTCATWTSCGRYGASSTPLRKDEEPPGDLSSATETHKLSTGCRSGLGAFV
jgi:hypothetical protein